LELTRKALGLGQAALEKGFVLRSRLHLPSLVQQILDVEKQEPIPCLVVPGIALEALEPVGLRRAHLTRLASRHAFQPGDEHRPGGTALGVLGLALDQSVHHGLEELERAGPVLLKDQPRQVDLGRIQPGVEPQGPPVAFRGQRRVVDVVGPDPGAKQGDRPPRPRAEVLKGLAGFPTVS